MHNSVMNFIGKHFRPEEIAGREILEIGALDVNGSPRDYINLWKPAKYVGTDMRAGKGVDLVLDGMKVHEHFGESAFDVVLCFEVLEHAENWKALVSSAKKVLRPGGIMFFTTRSPGFPYHEFPHDHWRFTSPHFFRIFSDMNTEAMALDDQFPGVFIKARKPANFKEADLSQVEAVRMEKPA